MLQRILGMVHPMDLQNGLDNFTESSNLFPTMKTNFVDQTTTIRYKYIVEYKNKSYSVDYFTDENGNCVKVDILNEWGRSLFEVEDDDVLSEIYNAVKRHLDKKRAPFRNR